MAASLSDIWAAVNSLTQQVARVAVAVGDLTHTTTSSTAAPGTAGTITFSSSLAEGFMIVATSSGATVKVPFYSNP